MTTPAAVSIPSAPATAAGILSVASPLPSGWERGGLAFSSDACRAAGTHVFCPDSPGEPKTLYGTETATFAPIVAELSVVCLTTQPDNEVLEDAGSVLPVIAEYNIGVELATGAAHASNPNPSLADATPLASATDVVGAIANVEAALAQFLRGFRGAVHMAPQTLVYAVAEGAVVSDFGRWVTPSGHTVIASAGYAQTLTDEVVGTTQVYASVGSLDRVRFVDHKLNWKIAQYEAPALAVFDPCVIVSSTITGGNGNGD